MHLICFMSLPVIARYRLPHPLLNDVGTINYFHTHHLYRFESKIYFSNVITSFVMVIYGGIRHIDVVKLQSLGPKSAGSSNLICGDRSRRRSTYAEPRGKSINARNPPGATNPCRRHQALLQLITCLRIKELIIRN